MASSASGQDVSNSTLWLDTRAGKMELSCSLGTTRRVPQEKFSRKPYNKSFSDQVSSVKMPGCWPRFFSWTSTLSRSINRQKRNLANIQTSWPHTWSITHIYYNYHHSSQWNQNILLSMCMTRWLLCCLAIAWSLLYFNGFRFWKSK